MRIRILLVDDQSLLRQGFRMILSAEPDLEVVGECGDGLEAVTMTRALRPDVVLMDIRMPRSDGIQATREIVAARLESKVIILTTFDLDEYAFQGLHAGASGFLLKDVAPADLVAAIRVVASGDAVISPRITRRLLTAVAPQLAPEGPTDDAVVDALTDREREVFTHVAAGLSNAEISSLLTLSETTVKTHVGRILSKLQLRDRVQVVILAYESGLSRPHGG